MLDWAPWSSALYLGFQLSIKESPPFGRVFLDSIKVNTRYTVRGRGAKHFFPYGSAPGEIYLNTRISQDSRHVPRTSHIVSSKFLISVLFHALVRAHSSGYVFVSALPKSRKIRVRKRSLNRLIVLVSFINGDPFSNRSKSKAQTAGRQEPRATLQIPFAKINYFAKNGRTNGHQFFYTTGWKERFA